MDIGTRINDQYTIVEHIGRGGMADVWSARDERLGRMVAIKTIVAGLTGDVDPVQLFQQEAKTIARMEHPHILPIYDFGDINNNLYIVMRFVTGGSLEDLLGNGPLPLEDVLTMGDAIARALDYAHSNNIIHLDLKPPNILLDSLQSPYLADFGLATVLDPEGRAQNPGSGTLLYMAPEQLTSDVIDHRADIYSYCIVLFHMLTGQLPFDGAMPLALKQLQFQEELPDVHAINPDLPASINEILRWGTLIDFEDRPKTHQEIIDDLRDLIMPDSVPQVTAPRPAQQTELPATIAPDLREAVDIYTRARHNWAGGQGRFVLGMTHFMLMSDTYRNASRHGLKIDEAGYQMLLRGALEYDFDVVYWWDRLDYAGRRWVCLHTLRSGTAPARIRALYRLETMPDDPQKPVIPRLVAQALEVEEDKTAKLAALQVLRTRARLLKPEQNFDIQSDFRGRLVSSLTRVNLTAQPAAVWRDVTYAPEVDLLVAGIALDEDETIAEAAGRTIGDMRSMKAVTYLAQEQANGRPRALRALAFVRDEVDALPDVVSRPARIYSWLANTVRRVAVRPLDVVFRFILILLGGWIAIGELIYTTFRSIQLLNPTRWLNALGVGLMFGLFLAVTVIVADELSKRLYGFWRGWLRLIVFGGLGLMLASLTWTAYTWMYLNYVAPLDVMTVAGFGLVFGFVMSGLFNLGAIASVILTAIATYTGVLALHLNYYETADFSIVPLAALGLVTGVWLGRQSRRANQTVAPFNLRDVLTGGVFGLVWAGLIWALFMAIFGDVATLSWVGTLGIVMLALFSGGLIAYAFTSTIRRTFTVTALIVFGALYLMFGWQFTDLTFSLPQVGALPLTLTYYDGLPLAPRPQVPVLYFDDLSQIFSVAIPIAITIALGGHGLALLRRAGQFVGHPRDYHERTTWATALLGYSMFVGLVIGVLSLFSAHVNPLWAVGWSVAGYALFITALATWRWALWGARGVLITGMIFVAGGLIHDVVTAIISAQSGVFPVLLQPSQLAIWGVYSAVVGVLTVAVMRRVLWAAIGLALMMPVWWILTLFLGAGGSLAAFALVHVALMAYALGAILPQMEADRWPLRGFARAAELQMSAPSATVTEPFSPTAPPVTRPIDLSELDLDTEPEDLRGVVALTDDDTVADVAPIQFVTGGMLDINTMMNPSFRKGLQRDLPPSAVVNAAAGSTDLLPDIATELDAAADYLKTQPPTSEKSLKFEIKPNLMPDSKTVTDARKSLNVDALDDSDASPESDDDDA